LYSWKACKVSRQANYRARCLARWATFNLVFGSILTWSSILFSTHIKNEKDHICNLFPIGLKRKEKKRKRLPYYISYFYRIICSLVVPLTMIYTMNFEYSFLYIYIYIHFFYFFFLFLCEKLYIYIVASVTWKLAPLYLLKKRYERSRSTRSSSSFPFLLPVPTLLFPF
jgi:hypothetical protein